MKKNAFGIILSLFNLLLAGFAIWSGILMISAVQVFSEFPKEWLGKVPFDSWLPYGIIAIVVFGLGNVLAVILFLAKRTRVAAIGSAILGALLCVILLAVFVVTGQSYLPGNMILLAGVLQLVLSVWLLVSNTRLRKEGN